MVLCGVLPPGLVQYCSHQLPSCFFSSRFVSVQVVHPYSSIDPTAAWKKLRFILSDRSDFHSLSIAVHAFVSRMSMSFSVDEPVGEPVYQFQRASVESGNVASLMKAQVFSFVCIDMEANACGGLFQTMQ